MKGYIDKTMGLDNDYEGIEAFRTSYSKASSEEGYYKASSIMYPERTDISTEFENQTVIASSEDNRSQPHLNSNNKKSIEGVLVSVSDNMMIAKLYLGDEKVMEIDVSKDMYVSDAITPRYGLPIILELDNSSMFRKFKIYPNPKPIKIDKDIQEELDSLIKDL